MENDLFLERLPDRSPDGEGPGYPRNILIVGPRASGKTQAVHDILTHLNAQRVSIQSNDAADQQTYGDIDFGTFAHCPFPNDMELPELNSTSHGHHVYVYDGADQQSHDWWQRFCQRFCDFGAEQPPPTVIATLQTVQWWQPERRELLSACFNRIIFTQHSNSYYTHMVVESPTPSQSQSTN